MRLLKSIWAVLVAGGVLLGGVGVGAQAKQTAPSQPPPAKKSAPAATPAPTKAAPTSTAPAQAKAPAKAASAPVKRAPAVASASKAKPPAASQGKPATESSEAAVEAPAGATGGSDMQPGNRRDPFSALVSRTGAGKQTAETTCRAPGKGGITIDTLRLDGIARSASAVIAVVRTPQQRVYFLREGDRLCDGRVDRITMEGLNLRQTSRDAFGKPIERIVSKRIFPSAGE